MGEVYRARDPRLARDVALKVLRGTLSLTAERVEQLSREARAAGSLNHPNIVTVFDVGAENGVPYVVSELLEGESLRDRLAGGALPFRKAIDYGIQIAEALGAAHEKGIIHRDVKPENAFLTREGRVKLLDFGLAKLREPPSTADPDDSTADEIMSSGIRGTAAYMSPEQVTGGTIDSRTDLFSLGAVLYEMFTGAHAFQRGSRVETMNAVLKDDPPDPQGLAPHLPRPAAVAVRRCLEKNREERFQSARDLSFHLQQIRDRHAERPPPPPRGVVLARRILGAALLAGTAAAVAVALAAAMRSSPPPQLDRLTFSRGRISGARFQTEREVLYSEARGEGGARLFSVDLDKVRLQPENVEARPLDALGPADLLAVRADTFALSLERRPGKGERFVGRLAEASGGGDPRPCDVEVEDADWHPTRGDLLAARTSGIGGESWLEYPVARRPGEGGDARRNKIYEPERGSVAGPRFSPDGRRIAFIEDAGGLGLGGRVMVFDLADRKVTPLTERAWTSARGVAWSRDGREVWFTAGERSDNRALRAVTLDRRERLVYQGPTSLTLWDVSRDGRVLFSQDEERKVIVGVPAGESLARDLSLHDRSGVADISADGRFILFSDRGGLFVKRIVDPPRLVHLLKEGFADALSPDGARAVATDPTRTRLLVLSRDEAIEPRVLGNSFEVTYEGASWFPDGQRILVNGRGRGGEVRAYVHDLRDDSMRVLTPAGTKGMTVSPDGRRVATTGGTGAVGIREVEAGPTDPSRRLEGSEEGDRPVAWSADGAWLWLFRRGEMPARVYRLHVESGARALWMTLVPPDPAGVHALSEFHVTPDGRAYVYSYLRVLSRLYVASGLR